jgi:dolichyl-phosphate beta-glucosyltransferase
MSDPVREYRCIVVVPCYDEAERLRVNVFEDFARANPSILLTFVNDGSRDSTLNVLRALHARAPETINVLNGVHNRGKAEAVRLGLNHALQYNRADVVGFWDADLATPLDAIPDLLGVLESQPDIEMVFGARVKLLGRKVERFAARHYLGRLFATVASVILRMPIYDTQCGAKLFRATPELGRVLQRPFLSRWIFDVEILARFIHQRNGHAHAVAATIYEYPLKVWVDIAGSKVRPKDFLRAILELAAIYRRYLTRTSRE